MASIIMGSAIIVDRRELKEEQFEVKLKKDKKVINRVFKTLLTYWVIAFIVTIILIGLTYTLSPHNTATEPTTPTSKLAFYLIIFLTTSLILYDTITGEIPFMTMFILTQYILTMIKYPGMSETQSMITGTILYITISITVLSLVYYKMRKGGVYLIYKNTQQCEE